MKHLQEYINNSTVSSRAELEAKIQELEQQLVEFRKNLANNEQRYQKQLTVVGALATAIKQTLSATKLAVEAGEPELVESFWKEMKDIQEGNYDEREKLALPSNKGNNNENNPDGGQGPHTYDSLVKLTLKDIKEIAFNLDLSVKQAKEYGSVRQKTSWITAILNKQDDQLAESKPIVTSPPLEKGEDEILDVSSVTLIEESTDNSISETEPKPVSETDTKPTSKLETEPINEPINKPETELDDFNDEEEYAGW